MNDESKSILNRFIIASENIARYSLSGKQRHPHDPARTDHPIELEYDEALGELEEYLERLEHD